MQSDYEIMNVINPILEKDDSSTPFGCVKLKKEFIL